MGRIQRVVTCVEQRLLLENEGNWDRDPELNFHFPVFVVCLDKNYNNSRLYVALDWSAALVPSGRGTASTSTPTATNTRCRREMMDVQTQNLKNENWSKHVEGINFPPLFVPRFNREFARASTAIGRLELDYNWLKWQTVVDVVLCSRAQKIQMSSLAAAARWSHPPA